MQEQGNSFSSHLNKTLDVLTRRFLVSRTISFCSDEYKDETWPLVCRPIDKRKSKNRKEKARQNNFDALSRRVLQSTKTVSNFQNLLSTHHFDIHVPQSVPTTSKHVFESNDVHVQKKRNGTKEWTRKTTTTTIARKQEEKLCIKSRVYSSFFVFFFLFCSK